MRCNGCRQPIGAGTFVSAGSLPYHPDCFRCGSCGALLGRTYKVASGKPVCDPCYVARHAPRCVVCKEPIMGAYVPHWLGKAHEACYLERYGPKCSVCGEPITEAYIQHQGRKAHEACYKESLAPRCKVCGQSIQEPRWLIHEGAPVHSDCFKRHVADRCDVCGGPITGKYIQDVFGHRYHDFHRKQFPPCHACGRLTAPDIGGPGGLRLDDGRHVCGFCAPSSVGAGAEAARRFDHVRRELADLGLVIPQEPLPLSIVSKPQLARILPRSSHPRDRDVQGLTLSEHLIQGGRVVRRTAEVFILSHLPATLFEGVAAHELGHAWIFTTGCPSHAHALAEGFCNYLQYLRYRREGTEEAEFYIARMMEDQDPAYGQGFRIVRKIAERKGFPALLEHMRKKTDFPLFGW